MGLHSVGDSDSEASQGAKESDRAALSQMVGGILFLVAAAGFVRFADATRGSLELRSKLITCGQHVSLRIAHTQIWQGVLSSDDPDICSAPGHEGTQ